jgi:dCMP deaminase
MERVNLIAYIPVLNNRHLDWFAKHSGAMLYLIPQELAVTLDHRQAWNVGAMPTRQMQTMIKSLEVLDDVWIFDDACTPREGSTFLFADDDICRAFAAGFGSGVKCEFESTWARYDMFAVKRLSPIMDVPQTADDEHRMYMRHCKSLAKISPDWWRQVGACLVVEGDIHASACNRHFPTDYVTDIMGDPRLNVDAGQVGKYVSFHSEKAVIAIAAREGISTKGASLYVSVFPCEDCARAIVLTGITHLFFEEGYSALDALEVLQSAGVQITQVVKDPSL